MIAGTLELQLMADVARLRADMDKGVSIVKASTDAMKRAADDVKQAFAGMSTGLTVAALIDFTKNTIDAAAKLRDLSVQAGMAVESLSGLAAVGKATGTGADMITAASNKLSKALATSNEESKGAATALKALGLSFDAFQKLTPDQRIQQVAMAMGMFNDGAQKSAAAMLLFGKAGAEMLPFLKDLAQTGQLHAKVTTEQAEAAHNFEVALGKLKTQADAWKRQLALELLPTLEAITTELLNMKAVANDPHSPSLLGEGIKTIFETVAALGVNVVYVLKQTSNEIGGIIAQVSEFMTAPNITDGLRRAAAVRAAMVSDAKTARQQVDQTTYNILGITNSRAGAGRSSAAQYQDPRLLSPTVPDFHKNLTGLEGNSGADGTKALEALVKHINEHIAAQQQELALGRQLTEQDKFETKARSDMAELMKQFPGLSAGVVDGLLKQSRAHADLISIRNADLQNNANYARDWAKTEQELAADDKARADERDRVNKTLADANSTLTDELSLLQAEAGLMGASNNERSIALANLKVEQDLKREIKKINEDLLLNEDQRTKAIAAATQNAELQKQAVLLREQIGIWNTIDQTAHDAFISIFEGGSNAFKKLGQSLKTELLDLLYQMTVRRWVFQIVGNVTGSGGIAGAIGNAVGLGGGGGSGGLLNTGSSLVSSSGMLGSIGGNGLLGSAFPAGGAVDSMAGTFGFGSGIGGAAMGAGDAAALAGSTEAGLLGAGATAGEAAAAGASLGASAAATGGAGMAAAGSMAAAAIPVIGWAIAAAGLLYSIFGQKAGGPKQDGRYGTIASGVAKYDKDLSPQNNAAAQQAAQGLQAQYDSIVSSFGGTGGIKYGLGFSTDPKGKSPTFLDITGSRDGQVVSNDVNLNVGRSQQELQAAIAQMGASAILKGLQQSNISGIMGDYLASLGDVAKLSADQVTQAIARIQKAGAEKQKLDDQYFQLSHTDTQNLVHQRQIELDALDDSNKAMAMRIFALQDETAAQQKAKQSLDQFTSVLAYLDKLNASPAGGLSRQDQLENAKSQFSKQSQLAATGDSNAISSITQYADQLISAQQAYDPAAADAVIAYVKNTLAGLQREATTFLTNQASLTSTLPTMTTSPITAVSPLGVVGAGTPAANAGQFGSFSISIPHFAAGGDSAGGLRLVGEHGIELEATGPARIFNATQTRQILSGAGDKGDLAQKVDVLTNEVRRLTALLGAYANRDLQNGDMLVRQAGATKDAVLLTKAQPRARRNK